MQYLVVLGTYSVCFLYDIHNIYLYICGVYV